MMSLFKALKEINAEGTTILLVEQNARLALQVRAAGLRDRDWRLVLEGYSKELLENAT